MEAVDHSYAHHDENLRGYIAFKKSGGEKKPAVLIFHDWTGRNEFACRKAEQLAELGYLGFAVDMFGEGRLGKTIEEKKALMEPLINNRHVLQERAEIALKEVKQMKEVDSSRIAAIGFCFGGLCALDLARSGADLKGIVSFHGLLNKPKNHTSKTIQAKILALHGYDDPMVPPSQLNDFCQEMTEARADWQVDIYGHTKHAFTNPEAHDQSLGTVYNEQSKNRSWIAMKNFLMEIF